MKQANKGSSCPFFPLPLCVSLFFRQGLVCSQGWPHDLSAEAIESWDYHTELSACYIFCIHFSYIILDDMNCHELKTSLLGSLISYSPFRCEKVGREISPVFWGISLTNSQCCKKKWSGHMPCDCVLSCTGSCKGFSWVAEAIHTLVLWTLQNLMLILWWLHGNVPGYHIWTSVKVCLILNETLQSLLSRTSDVFSNV